MRQAIGVDIGGTKILAGRVDSAGNITGTTTAATPAEPGPAVTAIIETIRSVIEESPDPIAAIGIGAAGLVDIHSGTVRYAPNLSYREVPLVALASDEFGVPVTLDNDATCAGYAEFRLGAGQDSRFMVMVTVGTGIGGGFVFEGNVFRGRNGFAAEIGHMVVDPSGPVCGCGSRGCWERLASGTALGEMGRAVAVEPQGSAILKAAGGDVSQVRGEHVTASALAGDPAAIEIINRLGTNLGSGLASLANILDPERFVIGGGVAGIGEVFLGPARQTLNARIEGAGFRDPVPVVAAELSNSGGIIGAALLALESTAQIKGPEQSQQRGH